jgi:hypothetical protein
MVVQQVGWMPAHEFTKALKIPYSITSVQIHFTMTAPAHRTFQMSNGKNCKTCDVLGFGNQRYSSRREKYIACLKSRDFPHG